MFHSCVSVYVGCVSLHALGQEGVYLSIHLGRVHLCGGADEGLWAGVCNRVCDRGVHNLEDRTTPPPLDQRYTP